MKLTGDHVEYRSGSVVTGEADTRHTQEATQ